MAGIKGGLGKGLDALFMENDFESITPTSLKLNDIVPNKDQPRKQFDDDALRELADSISQHGILQPLLVRPLTNGTYQLVAGERRWRAAQIAGLREAPVVIREMTDKDADTFALIENLQREDLNPMEEAKGYKSLIDSYNLTQDDAAKIVNKSRPAITNALRLLDLPDSISNLVANGSLSAGHARAILSFDTEDEQKSIAEEVIAKNLSVRAVERLAAASHKPTTSKTPKSKARPTFYDEVELALTDQLKRKVKVVAIKKGGILQLEFYNQDDLRDLANTIAPDKD